MGSTSSRPPAVRHVPVVELKINPDNPRSISDERLEDLKASLRADPEMLAARPVIATPDGTVVAGNMRLLAAQELKLKTIPALIVPLSKEKARLWMLRDNQAYGDWLVPEVGELLSELLNEGVDLGLTGFSSEDSWRSSNCLLNLVSGLVHRRADGPLLRFGQPSV